MNGTVANKYLIIQTAFLGDVVLSLSMAEYIKQQEPNSYVVYVTIPNAKPIAAACPYIDEVIAFDKKNKDQSFWGLFNMAARLRKYNFAAVFTPHRSIRSAVLSYLTGSKKRYGFDKNSGNVLYSDRIKYNSADHEILRNLSLVSSFWKNGGNHLILPTIGINGEKSDTIALAPGAVWKTKRWPEEKWAELITHPYLKDKPLLLIGGKADVAVADNIMRLVNGGHLNIKNRVGKDDLPATFQRIANCKLIISNDSAPQHFAMAVRTPVITIFGSTVTDFGFYPVGEYDSVVQTDLNLTCRPCGIHGKRFCPISTFDCMNSIEVEKVVQKIKDVYQWQKVCNKNITPILHYND